MKQILLAILFVFGLNLAARSQTIILSPQAEISIMTCGPSELIHAIYGHTAVRVNDPVRNWDVVFNYGIFSFSEPNFVYRFAKGNANYMLAPERFSDFYQEYIRNGRSVWEQVLNLTLLEKQKVLNFLVDNAKPENREYRYNFFYDNCATRVRDLIADHVDGRIEFPTKSEGMTFREHAAEYQKILPWTNFGINLVLGSPSDEIASAYDEMFLPDYLFAHFADATVIDNSGKARQLIKDTRTLFEADPVKASWLTIHSPELILLALLILIFWTTVRQLHRERIRYGVDYALLFITGLSGLVLLWFFFISEHPAMKSNYNQLWAICLNLLFLFLWLVKKWRPVLRWYWVALSLWLLLFFLLSIFLPQQFVLGFYLLIAMLLVRSLFHSRFVIMRT